MSSATKTPKSTIITTSIPLVLEAIAMYPPLIAAWSSTKVVQRTLEATMASLAITITIAAAILTLTMMRIILRAKDADHPLVKIAQTTQRARTRDLIQDDQTVIARVKTTQLRTLGAISQTAGEMNTLSMTDQRSDEVSSDDTKQVKLSINNFTRTQRSFLMYCFVLNDIDWQSSS